MMKFKFFPLKNRWAFNWHSSFGYLFAFIFVYASACCTFSCVVLTICLVVGSSLFAHYITEDILNDLIECSKMLSNANHKEIKKLFCNVMHNVSQAKELSASVHCAMLFSKYKITNKWHLFPLIDWFTFSITLLSSVSRLYSWLRKCTMLTRSIQKGTRT